MTTTVLIPTHGRPTLLDRSLRSLTACRLPARYRETVVVENGSRAGAEAVVAEVAREHPVLRLRYMHVKRANKSHALNEALATVGNGLVVFFDDDVRLDPGVLEAYAEAAERHPRNAFFGGPTDVDYELQPPEWLIPFFPPSARGVSYDSNGLELYLGFNWAAYADELLALGGFNPDFGPGSPTGATGQEGEMHLRLMEAGFAQCDVPDALVWHYVPHERSTKGWLCRRTYRHGIMAGRFDSREELSLPVAKTALGNGLRCAAAAAKKAILRDEVGLWRALFGLSTNAGRFVGALRQPSRTA